MAISFIATGAFAAGTTSLSVPYPAGLQAGDLLVLAISNKYPTNGPATPADWTAPANSQGTGGSGSSGVDTGNVYATIFVKIATGSESGNLSVTITSGNSAIGLMALYRKAADKTWDYACVNGADNTVDTSWSVTGGSNPGITSGDVVFTCSAINADTYSFTSHALAATGVTFGTILADGSNTALGQDCYIVLTSSAVSSGTASTAPTLTMTASSSATNSPAGATVFLRMREVTGGYTLTAEAGTYTQTGQAAGLLSSKKLTASTGTYSLTGVAANLLTGRKVASVAGTYTLSGQTAVLRYNRIFTAEAGNLALNGANAGLLFNRILTAQTGIYVLTGNDATLIYAPLGNFELNAESGAISISGQDATLKVGRRLIAEAEVYILTGHSANLVAGKVVQADTGGYAISGVDASLITTRILQAANGAYTITGINAALSYSESETTITISLNSHITTSINASSEISNNFNGQSKISNLVNL
jgi:MSHA biogenesis protein MshQ